ncbi:uncharacterized protein EDB91DRAFT_1085758 [Suillus paluster]|uniref:uncharacterized protein n=1 Tax=Suillus paluster TaxID=48578 RepID=UPI001B86FDAE|nr:uncharacterized protein EDB91DRAFT_1085758 [Suillus paluster]KAG1729310.1 hypothetical protein EDB91DRAFT_1085758 [Suillus paluster]
MKRVNLHLHVRIVRLLHHRLHNPKNLGEYATRNTKRTRLNQAQAKEKKNVQPVGVDSPTNTDMEIPGVTFSNSSSSPPPVQDSLNTSPSIDVANLPFSLNIELIFDAAKIIETQELLSAMSGHNIDKIFTTADCDHDEPGVDENNSPEQASELEINGDKDDEEADKNIFEDEPPLGANAELRVCPEGTGLAWEVWKPPEVSKATSALKDIKTMLKPP